MHWAHPPGLAQLLQILEFLSAEVYALTRQSCSFANLVIAICVALFPFASLTHANAQTESVIHSFRSTSVFDGITPLSGVVADKNGALYGTTQSGGKYGYGMVYKLVPPATQGGTWTQNLLYSFTGSGDGAFPSGALVLRRTGKIYGTTQSGGRYGQGAVYQLSPPASAHSPWTEILLYSFSGGIDGGDPFYGVIVDAAGRLYGTTDKGGAHKAGSVFVLSPPAQQGGAWRQRNLYSFQTASNGALPYPGGLALDAMGSLYGVLESSGYGQETAGSVFQLSPPSGGSGAWTESVLYAFSGSLDGYGPTGTPVFDGSGTLYGATAGGGEYGAGTIFSVTPPATEGGAWTENVLYSFTGISDGLHPDSGLVLDSAGALYGVTLVGGIQSCGDSSNGCGAAYKLIPPSAQGGAWTEETLHIFAGDPDGSDPEAPLLVLGTSVYGTTITGGTGPCSGPVGIVGCGSVFQILQ